MIDQGNWDVRCVNCGKGRGGHWSMRRDQDEAFSYCYADRNDSIFSALAEAKNSEHVLPTDSEERKEIPLFSGLLNYFPLALAAVARHSKRGNDKHNPGQPLHWARGKSMDHLDCIGRHLLDVETVNAAGEYEEATAIAWRALAHLQEVEEKRLGKPWSRGSK